jgi:hypothetical protein
MMSQLQEFSLEVPFGHALHQSFRTGLVKTFGTDAMEHTYSTYRGSHLGRLADLVQINFLSKSC